MLRLILPLLILSSSTQHCESARILGVVPTPSYSHQVVFRPIWTELAKRGHDVTVITTDPENGNITNIKEIDVSFAYELWTKKYNVIKVAEKYRHNPFKIHEIFSKAIFDICDQELLHPEVENLMRNETEHFDLVIVELLFTAMVGFVERFKCPYIGVVSLDLPNMFHSFLGNPVHPVAYPDLMLPFEGKLNFWERLLSSTYHWFSFVMHNIHDTNRQLMEKHFGGVSDIDIIKNVSMVFLNLDLITNVRPLGPGFVLIGGGTHLHSPKPLPEDLQDYLDSAKNGAIYFSLGTNVKSETVPLELRKTMLQTFKELPYQVLWKFDVADIPDLPENVKIVNWLPQQDILRHPRVKLFITQGGLQSMEEAIFCNVPLIGIPFIGDQDTNVMKMAKKGFGLHVDKSTLTKESFKEAILEVINNPKYKQRTIEIAELSKDQPMTGLEKAVWWTEYVIRHKGAPHLRNPIIDLPFYQYYLLDVIGTLVGLILILIYVIYKSIVFIINFIFKLCFRRKIKQN